MQLLKDHCSPWFQLSKKLLIGPFLVVFNNCSFTETNYQKRCFCSEKITIYKRTNVERTVIAWKERSGTRFKSSRNNRNGGKLFQFICIIVNFVSLVRVANGLLPSFTQPLPHLVPPPSTHSNPFLGTVLGTIGTIVLRTNNLAEGPCSRTRNERKKQEHAQPWTSASYSQQFS